MNEVDDDVKKLLLTTFKLFEVTKVPHTVTSEWNRKIEESDTMSKVMKVIIEMIEFVSCTISKQQASLSEDSYLVQKKDDTPISMGKSKETSDSSYLCLEKLVQKYEGELRKHVRVEQSMKIFAETLQERIEILEKLCDEEHAKLEVLDLMTL